MITVLYVFIAFVAGIAIGARGYYLYANHIYMRYPGFFKLMLEYKIAKRQGKTDSEAYKLATEKEQEEA